MMFDMSDIPLLCTIFKKPVILSLSKDLLLFLFPISFEQNS